MRSSHCPQSTSLIVGKGRRPAFVTAIGPWGDDSELGELADFSRSMFATLNMTGPYLTTRLNNIAAYGGEGSKAVERTGAAELSYVWSKDGYEPVDVGFDVDGKTVCVPKAEEAQKLVGA